MEIWRSFPLDRRYQVSTLGRVRRKSSKKLRKACVMPNGYAGIVLTKPQHPRKYYYHHFMVALTWLGPRPPKMEISHLDGNKLNNAVKNLAYETKKENANKWFNTFNKFGSKRKLTYDLVVMIRKDKLLTSREWARELGVVYQTIYNIRKFITWKKLLAKPQTK